MKRLFFLIPVFVVIIALTNFSESDNDEKFEHGILDKSQAVKYRRVKYLLDIWARDSETLNEAQSLIEELKLSVPSFAPIRIEEARLILLRGEKNDKPPREYNNDALKVLLKLKNEVPGYSDTYKLLGHVYVNIGQLDKAISALDKAKKMGNEDPWLYLNYTNYYRAMGNTEAALEYAKRGLYAKETNEIAISYAVRSIIELSTQLNESIDEKNLSKMVLNSIESSKQKLLVARALIDNYAGKNTNLRVAHLIIQNELNEDNNNDFARFLMAEWYFTNSLRYTRYECGKRPEWVQEGAIPLYQSLLGNKNYFLTSSKRLFDFAIGNENLGEAEKIIDAVSKFEEYKFDSIWLRARLNYCLGKYEYVIKTLESVSEEFPSFLSSNLLAESYSKLGSHEKLNTYYLDKIERNKNNAHLLGNYAEFLFYRMQRGNQAIEYYKKALKILNYKHGRNTLYTFLYISMRKSYMHGYITYAREYYDQIVDLGYREEFEANNCYNTGCSLYQDAIEFFDNEAKNKQYAITRPEVKLPRKHNLFYLDGKNVTLTEDHILNLRKKWYKLPEIKTHSSLTEADKRWILDYIALSLNKSLPECSYFNFVFSGQYKKYHDHNDIADHVIPGEFDEGWVFLVCGRQYTFRIVKAEDQSDFDVYQVQ